MCVKANILLARIPISANWCSYIPEKGIYDFLYPFFMDKRMLVTVFAEWLLMSFQYLKKILIYLNNLCFFVEERTMIRLDAEIIATSI